MLTKYNYQRFVEEFSSKLSSGHSDTCFFIFGSFYRGDYTPNGSDVDGCIILNSDVITPKNEVLQISQILANCLASNRVPVQINLTDTGTNRDGRFLSYTTDYIDYFRESARVISGPDLISEMNGLDYKSGVLYSTAFNFRKIRNRLLHTLDNKINDYAKLKKDVRSTISQVIKIPTKFIWLLGVDKIVTHPKEKLKILSEILPGYDVSELEEFYELTKQLKDSDFPKDDSESIRLSIKSVETIERMIAVYIKTHPTISERELKVAK